MSLRARMTTPESRTRTGAAADGGTAHMVSLARAYANVDIKVITTPELQPAAAGVGG